MTQQAVIVAARRTAVAPHGGALKAYQADELAAPVIRTLLDDAGISGRDVDYVLMGNALYGGGNPARMAVLRAGLPETVPAMTIDTQCCSGLDAIVHAAHMIQAGAAQCIVAGGAESFSRSPIRSHRPMVKGDLPVQYSRPAFSPFADRDPDLTEAAAMLADVRGISREAQAEFAVDSHKKAMRWAEAGDLEQELVDVGDLSVTRDEFARKLSLNAAVRAPVLAGSKETGVSAATVAVEADAAAAVLVTSEELARNIGAKFSIKVTGSVSAAANPAEPALVPIMAVGRLCNDINRAPSDFDRVELMEAYAVQAMVTLADLEIPAHLSNCEGGALARGHPIGASGALLAVRLFHGLRRGKVGATGLAAIAAAGGLGTALSVAGN